ncbi:hypothetical protein NL676_033470 [Syzygium grande]|nr:hypothetical protein NL676_033470 [Syzygium grande]
MAQKHNAAPDPAAEPKKRRRVGFSGIDAGVDPNGCIKVYLVSREEEVGVPDSFCLDPVDLSHFFEEDGKIYGYQGLNISVWSKSDGGKGITDLNTALKDMFGETLVDNKDDFLQTFSKETQFIRSAVSAGEILEHKYSDGHVNDSISNLKAVSSDVKAVLVERIMKIDSSCMSGCAHADGGDMTAGHLYSRLVPLVLLLVDGSNPIDITDSSWELYLLIHKTSDQQGNFQDRLLGFAAVYRFYRYPDSSRLRLGQILVLPLYQRKGYGRYLLEVLNNVAIADGVYDFTIEEPVDNLQHLRTCIDVKRLLSFDKVQQAVNSTVSQLKQGKLSKKTYIPRLLPPPSVVEDARKHFKINKKQFFQCWEILVYVGLDPADKSIQDYCSVISNRVRADILGKDSETAGKKVIEVPSDFDPEMSFVMHRAQAGGEANGIQVEDNQNKQEEQLQQLIDERLKDIKLIAQKVSRK